MTTIKTLPLVQDGIIITAAGGPDVLHATRLPVPVPGPGEVLVRVAAAGVNRHDCNQRRMGPSYDPNPVPGLEVSGIIVALGEGVPQTRLGERVAALVQGGGYAQYALGPAELALPVPEGLTLTEAAALPEALFTAWFNFFDVLRLRPGERVLIHGGTSGVASLAIPALTACGYEVFATCGNARKCEAAIGFGARAAFDYHASDLAARVKGATGGHGVDVILDVSAGAHLAKDLEMLAPDGRIGHLSAGGGKLLEVPLRTLMAKCLSITGSLLRPLPLTRKRVVAEQVRREVWPLLGTQVRPVIAATFPLLDAAAAHAAIEQGEHVGKILLTVDAGQ
ncbi:NAD(P)H-quinone oxidoreductase [Acidocella aminolytica]|uniref:Alcohol dehydrogenase n=1 Tax=Acidocella aminolytica 101 = DSM 11237 TaxID=1120923 RepID=A0A0D6PL11_9PROT|nr:NAD(P)H-quinone oxidoreductase [Acidocella aminolytica]GAN81449.1 alcohol dehydrogenase [Acidocella aminolytica 101 = DSM 11237]GBQ41837.1 NADPH:quinone reductase [Acidocella aminolytica 101 = DSM 11237]SHF01737.1 putative NAD(P)H quinone oxidoreductase, PIG3 family [Acidocella aminolytica 101 = DSM 11237]